MKLRIDDRSVRLRVRRSEVKAFADTGCAWTTLQMPGGRAISFGIASASLDQLTLSSTGDRLEVLIPRDQGNLWSSTGQVGIYGRHDSVDILVEKDFRRTSAPSPDDDDRYPNPRARA